MIQEQMIQEHSTRALRFPLVSLALFSLALFACLAAPLAASAAEFHLLDGTTLTGVIVEEGDESVIILDSAGNRRTLVFDDILGVTFGEGTDGELEKAAKKERRKLARERQRRFEKLMKSLARADEAERSSIASELDNIDVSGESNSSLRKLLYRTVRSKKEAEREYALHRLDKVESPATVVPLVVASLRVTDGDFPTRAEAAARRRDEDLARRVYEHVASAPGIKPAYRARALGHMGSIGSRQSVPTILAVAEYVTTDIRLTLLNSKGIRSQPVDLGSLGAAASQVEIDLPEAELIEVQTSVTVPVAAATLKALQGAAFSSLAAITGEDHGEDLGAWKKWWASVSPADSNSKNQ